MRHLQLLAHKAGHDGMRNIFSNSKRNHKGAKQERRLGTSKNKKGIHSCTAMFDHVSER